MRFERARRRRGPGLTPLIDVVFLLLVFFMLAARLADDRALALETRGAGAADQGDDTAVEVTLAADGRTLVDGAPLPSPAALGGALRARLRARPRAPVRVEADDAVELARIAAALEAVERAGGARVALVARPASGPPPGGDD